MTTIRVGEYLVPATIVLEMSTNGIKRKMDNQNWLKICSCAICTKTSSIRDLPG
jgi:hypothetical protein